MRVLNTFIARGGGEWSGLELTDRLEWCFIISVGVSSDHSQLRCTGFAENHYHESD